MKKLNKKAMWCMYVASGIEFIISAIVVLVLHILITKGVFGGSDNIMMLSKLILFLIPIDLIISCVSPKIRYERYRYSLTEEELDVREGLIVLKRSIVPIERLHKIEVHQGPIDRMFGLEKVKVITAGGEVTVSFLEVAEADFIAETLKKKINEIVIEKRSEECEYGK